MKDRFKNFMTAQDERRRRIRDGWLFAIFMAVVLAALAWLLIPYLTQPPNDVQSMAHISMRAAQPQPAPAPSPTAALAQAQSSAQPDNTPSKGTASAQASATPTPSAQPELLVEADAEASLWISSEPVEQEDMPDFAKRIEAFLPGVVRVAPYEPLPSFMQGEDQAFSGIILQNGFVLTNAHRILQDEVWVTDQNGDTLPAKVQGVDRPSGLALLKLEQAGKGDEPPFVLGQADEGIALGSEVMVLCSYEGGYVSKGIITQACTQKMIGEDESMIYHTDIALGERHAGGIAFSAHGRILGVVVQLEEAYEIMGCAYAGSVAQRLMEKSVIERVGIGVNGVYLDEAEAEELGLHKGIYVTEAILGGPARRAGLRAGDIIIQVAGEEVQPHAHIRTAVEQSGERAMPVVFIRNGCEVYMEARPVDLTPILRN
jgi:S1-C subfamily serine protease